MITESWLNQCQYGFHSRTEFIAEGFSECLEDDSWFKKGEPFNLMRNIPIADEIESLCPVGLLGLKWNSLGQSKLFFLTWF
jgi:hypothetical protein